MKYLYLTFLIAFLAMAMACQPAASSNNHEGGEQEADKAASLDSIPFERVTYSDTIFTDPSDPEAPMATYSEFWLIPQSGVDSLDQFIMDILLEGAVQEQGVGRVEAPRQAFEEGKQAFFEDFRQVMKEAGDFMTGFAYETSMRTEWNTPHLLTLGFFAYTFTGGAHGNYGSSYVTLDLDNRKKLGLEDVFKPGYEAAVTTLLEKKVREHFEMAPDTPLNEFLFENEIPITSNFGLMEDGILFNYPPYDVAPYAAGEIGLLLEYSEIGAYLKMEIK